MKEMMRVKQCLNSNTVVGHYENPSLGIEASLYQYLDEIKSRDNLKEPSQIDYHDLFKISVRPEIYEEVREVIAPCPP